MTWPQSRVTTWLFRLVGFRLHWIVVQSFFLLEGAVTATPPVVRADLMHPHQVQWTVDESTTVTELTELDAILDRLHAENDGEPILVTIDGPAGELTIGVGYSQSVLTYVPPDGDPPYLISSNKSKDETEIDFFYASHHSPMLAQNLIPNEVARIAVRRFVEYGALLAEARWSMT